MNGNGLVHDYKSQRRDRLAAAVSDQLGLIAGRVAAVNEERLVVGIIYQVEIGRQGGFEGIEVLHIEI